MSLKLLYVEPAARITSLRSKIRNWLVKRDINSNQEGFFVQSLQHAADVTCIKRSDLDKVNLQEYDFLVVNSKATSTGTEADLQKEFEHLQKLSIPKAIFITNARSSFMPGDDVLDPFDVIFKREPFMDRDRYAISGANRMKIVKTMLPCPVVSSHELKNLTVDPGYPKKIDVFFNGQATNPLRSDVVRILRKEVPNFYGGLIPMPTVNVPPELQFKKVSREEYKKLIWSSKINIAVDGIGSFTYRHLEILSQGGFLLSFDSIGDLDLPINLRRGGNYASFTDEKDLLEKIRYYLSAVTERDRIASQGFRQFQEDYSFEKHGNFLVQSLRK